MEYTIQIPALTLSTYRYIHTRWCITAPYKLFVRTSVSLKKIILVRCPEPVEALFLHTETSRTNKKLNTMEDTKCSSVASASLLSSPFLTPSLQKLLDEKEHMQEWILEKYQGWDISIIGFRGNNIHLFHNKVVGPIAAEIIPKSEDAAAFLYLHVSDNISLKASFIVPQGKKIMIHFMIIYANHKECL
jgi:hypothetical protein